MAAASLPPPSWRLVDISHEVSTKFIGSSLNGVVVSLEEFCMLLTWPEVDEDEPEAGINLGILSASPSRSSSSSSASSKSIEPRLWLWTFAASFMKALNGIVSKIEGGRFGGGPAPSLTYWFAICLRCAAREKFSISFDDDEEEAPDPDPDGWGDMTEEDGVGGGAMGGDTEEVPPPIEDDGLGEDGGNLGRLFVLGNISAGA